MMKKFTDEELINQYLKTRNEHCFDQLYKRYVSKVFRKCLSFVKDPIQAEDLTQDIFLRLLIKLEDYKQKAKFSTWLYSITYNYCIDHIRRTRWRQGLSSLESKESMDIPADTDLAKQQELINNQLQKALQCLTGNSQYLLEQKYQNNISIRELADQYSLSESAIKMRLKRSREQLRQLYWQVDAF